MKPVLRKEYRFLLSQSQQYQTKPQTARTKEYRTILPRRAFSFENISSNRLKKLLICDIILIIKGDK